MKPRISRFLFPSLADLTFVGTFLLVLWFGPFISNRDGDMGWHIAIGRYIIQHLTIPRTDLFSYTFYGQPFVPHEWLSEVVFAGAYMLGGFVGVALITAAAVAVTFAGLAAVMQRRGVAPVIIMPLVALGVITSISTWAARPHILTYVFTFVWATAMEEYRLGNLGRRGLLWLLPVMALWVNFHGAFLIGDALIGTYMAGAVWMYLVSAPSSRGAYGRQIVELAVLLVLCLLVSGLNPSGFSLIANNFGFFNQGTLLKVTPEWQSPDFHNPLFYPLLLLIGLALVISVRREITAMLLLVSWTFFTLYSFRNSAQLIIITLPLIGTALQSQIADFVRSPERLAGLSRWARHQIAMPRVINARLRDAQGQVVGGALSAIVVVVMAILLGTGVKIDMAHFGYGFRPASFPIEAVQKIKPFPPGKRVFNDSMWGGYLAFAYWPDVLNFIDGRIDFYGTAHKQDYYRVLNGEPGWKDVLDRYQVDWVMVQDDRPLVPWLEQDPSWEKIYSDSTAVVFVRRP